MKLLVVVTLALLVSSVFAHASKKRHRRPRHPGRGGYGGHGGHGGYGGHGTPKPTGNVFIVFINQLFRYDHFKNRINYFKLR